MASPNPGLLFIGLEDLILTKLIALRKCPDRIQDAQDVLEIVTAREDRDWMYLNQELTRHCVTIPEQFKGYFPERIEQIVRKVRRTNKTR